MFHWSLFYSILIKLMAMNKFSETVAEIQTWICRTFPNDSKHLMRWISCRIRCKAKAEQRLNQHVRSPVTVVLASNLPKVSNFFHYEQRWAGLFHPRSLLFTPTWTLNAEHKTNQWRKMTFGSCWRIVKLLNLSEQHLLLEVALCIHNWFGLWSIECSLNGLKDIYLLLLDF